MIDTQLDKCLSDLRQKHPNSSDSQLANRAGISRSSWNRLQNCDDTRPSLENFIKIIVASGNSKLLSHGLEQYDPKLSAYITQALEISLNEKNGMRLDNDLEQPLKDRDVFVALLMCLMDSGASEKQL